MPAEQHEDTERERALPGRQGTTDDAGLGLTSVVLLLFLVAVVVALAVALLQTSPR